MLTYRADVHREGRWWIITVPDVPNVVTQARHVNEIDFMARDAVASVLDVAPDSFDIDVRIRR